MKLEAKVHMVVETKFENSFLDKLSSKYSSWTRLLRITAYLLRFIKLCKDRIARIVDHCPAYLTVSELNNAENIWFKFLQSLHFKNELLNLKNSEQISHKSRLTNLNPFNDDKGIIRVGGRLQQSELSFKSRHPIVLEKHSLLKLIVQETHERCFHGGIQATLSQLRQILWIIHGRSIVKSVLHNCLVCVRHRAQLSKQIMAPLPKERVCRPERAFSDCGVDYAGPLQVRMAGGRGHRAQSCYSMFVCLAVKAIHLEVVTDYSAAAFIASFQRFVSLRGRPNRMFSDCGTNFKGATRELDKAFRDALIDAQFKNLLANDRIDWCFNPPAAPHFGGLWEAGVKSMKKHLVKIFGNRTPTYEDLSTAIHQISAMVAIPQPSILDCKASQLTRWQQMQQCSELFWTRWSQDYLQTYMLYSIALSGNLKMNQFKSGKWFYFANQTFLQPNGFWVEL